MEHEHPDLSKINTCDVLITSPKNMRPYFLKRIEQEIAATELNRRMIIKSNSLVDPELIQALYRAAESGVKIDLIIRGICTVLTQQPSFKKKMNAISIVDQYLEHARVFVFSQGDEPRVYISSADWMRRNLDHRVEVACPIFSQTFSDELKDILKIQLKENVKARILDNKHRNVYVKRTEKERSFRSQIEIYNYLKGKKYD